MAMNGSFAGGLADGLRNGMAIAQAYDLSKERRRQREVDEKLAAVQLNDDSAQQAPGAIGLQRMPVSAPGSSALTANAPAGLQPVPVGDSTAASLTPVAASGLGLADVAPGASGMGVGMPQSSGGMRPTLGAEKKSPPAVDYLGGGDFGQVADGLTRAYRKALELGEPGRAMQMLVDREKFIGQHREQAFAAAQGRYQLTGDPNAFIPFVNRFMPGGIEVKSINKRAELAGGAPLYDFVGLDKATGKPVEQPITENMLQTFVRSISDPKAQQAMVAQQAKLLYEAEQKRRDKLLDSDLRMKEEHAKPRLVGKDQTLYSPDGAGGMRVAAQGSEAAKPKQVTSDKDLASYVMRLNGVDSMEGLGQDQRKMVGDIVAIGENINRLNAGTPAGKMLTPANLAALSQQVRAGTANFEAIPLANGNVGFAVSHEGARVRVPLSMVPNQVQQMVAARLEGGRSPDAGPGQSSVAPAAPSPAVPAVSRAASQTQPRGPAPASTSLNSASGDSAEGVQLDAARAQLRDAEAVVRQLRVKPPGLKAGAAARDRHAAEIAKAERDVELARTAERAAAERWSRATDGSPIARAAMGQTTAE